LLTRTLGRVLGCNAEAAHPGIKGSLTLGGAQRSQYRGADQRIEPMGLQLLLDSTKTEARRSPAGEAFGESLLAQPTFLLKAIENRIELIRRLGVWRELSVKFLPALLSLRQQTQRPASE